MKAFYKKITPKEWDFKEDDRPHNKLIAEFMGYDISTIASNEIEVVEFENNDVKVENLRYHTSWDWLMPVVAKCREQSNAEDSHWEAVYYSLEDCDIDVTYKAVVKFINQYKNK